MPIARFPHTDQFIDRHIGPTATDVQAMLSTLGYSSMEQFIDAILPTAIRSHGPLGLGEAQSEFDILRRLRDCAAKNQCYRSYIGMGYANCITPPVILRNILENPGWYTPYTPYQAEVAQGRLEALLNFQTLIGDLTDMPVANASLLDEATAAAEAMHMCRDIAATDATSFFVSERCHPQTIAVVKTRAAPLGIAVIVGDHERFDFATPVCGALVQYPATDGALCNYEPFIRAAHARTVSVVVATDPLACALCTPPGAMGADIVVGNAQRFGIPLGYGGPHPAFLATRTEHARSMPGRLIGVSVDRDGNPALRLALQTREQHIRRAKATSNICTAQVLLAVMAGMYGVYHGPRGLRRIAERIHRMTAYLAAACTQLGYATVSTAFFDTVQMRVTSEQCAAIRSAALARKINLRYVDTTTVGVTLDETTSAADLEDLVAVFAAGVGGGKTTPTISESEMHAIPPALQRASAFATHPIFNRYHSETEMLRYITRLQSKDLTLATSMTPLGSCTMKLNATTELLPVTWPEFNGLHPFVPLDQAKGYQTLIADLEAMLKKVTGFAAISLQPNAGSQGEYAGLLAIHAYHAAHGGGQRDVCLIPHSAHGTNPATAAMAGMTVVGVACDTQGNIDLEDLRAKAAAHRERLATIMVTYPSTHGVFEEGIRAICDIVHANGGQVYMDGANLNALVGLSKPAEFGVDVCHLNLHKTFCIPHGGGGPGVGPIGVREHLVPFLPSHAVVKMGGERGIGAVAAAPWGSASILPISYAYIAMMGDAGMRRASEVAILNANYIATRLAAHYPVVYRGRNGGVAHECIVDLRPLKATAEIEVEDVAKRLMDYGFHAPTISWPIAGTMMIEPTESESKAEIDRFCDAMIAIRAEIQEVIDGTADRENNVVKNAPHPAHVIAADTWDRPYSRERAAYPAPWLRDHKYWPPVSRINNPYGDRNLVCTCQGDVSPSTTN